MSFSDQGVTQCQTERTRTETERDRKKQNENSRSIAGPELRVFLENLSATCVRLPEDVEGLISTAKSWKIQLTYNLCFWRFYILILGGMTAATKPRGQAGKTQFQLAS